MLHFHEFLKLRYFSNFSRQIAKFMNFLTIFFFRYFVLDNGSLSYGKSANEVKRGRTHGVIDVGTSVISAKTELYRIDIDDENYIHHIKVHLSHYSESLIFVQNFNFHETLLSEILLNFLDIFFCQNCIIFLIISTLEEVSFAGFWGENSKFFIFCPF